MAPEIGFQASKFPDPMQSIVRQRNPNISGNQHLGRNRTPTPDRIQTIGSRTQARPEMEVKKWIAHRKHRIMEGDENPDRVPMVKLGGRRTGINYQSSTPRRKICSHPPWVRVWNLQNIPVRHPPSFAMTTVKTVFIVWI